MTERRERQLKQEGVDFSKVERQVQHIMEDFKLKDFSLRESQLVVKKLDCVLCKMERRNPGTKLNEIVSQD